MSELLRRIVRRPNENSMYGNVQIHTLKKNTLKEQVVIIASLVTANLTVINKNMMESTEKTDIMSSFKRLFDAWIQYFRPKFFFCKRDKPAAVSTNLEKCTVIEYFYLTCVKEIQNYRFSSESKERGVPVLWFVKVFHLLF